MGYGRFVDGRVIRARMAAKDERVRKGITARLRATKKRLQTREDRRVYDAVTVRDHGRCRACGAYAGLECHRHHLRGREFTTVEDVCLVCPDCHERLHVRIGGKTLKMYGNADVTTEWGLPCGLTVEMLIPDHGWVKWCDR